MELNNKQSGDVNNIEDIFNGFGLEDDRCSKKIVQFSPDQNTSTVLNRKVQDDTKMQNGSKMNVQKENFQKQQQEEIKKEYEIDKLKAEKIMKIKEYERIMSEYQKEQTMEQRIQYLLSKAQVSQLTLSELKWYLSQYHDLQQNYRYRKQDLYGLAMILYCEKPYLKGYKQK